MDDSISRASSTLCYALGAKRGDQVAWQHLEAKVRPWIHSRLARENVPGDLEADDVVQAVLIEIFKRLDTFDIRSRASFRTWVHQLTDHKLTDLWRRARARKRGDGLVRALEDLDHPHDAIRDGSSGPSTIAARAELFERVETLLRELPATDREVLRLREEEGLGYGTIATRLGYTKEETARKRFFRAREKRQRLVAGLARDIFGARPSALG